MRSTFRPLLAAALMLSLAACGDRFEEPEGPRVTVLFTTDEHSNLFAVGPEVDDFDLVNHTLKTGTGDGSLKGGVARRYVILQAERAAAAARGSSSITVSAGDFTEGSLVNAALLTMAPDFVLMRRMEYDAVALGNHEFDLGPAGLAGQIAIASGRLGAEGKELPPLVLTNALTAGTPLEALYGAGKAIAPSRVVPKGDLKIGIVSWLGVSSGTDAAGAAPVRFWSTAATTSQQKFAEIAAAVQAAVNGLRANDGVDVVIALGHGGIGPLVTGPGDDEIITSLTSGIDLVVSGHSHKAPHEPHVVTAADGRSIPIVQAAPYGREIGRIELIVPAGGRAVASSAQTAFIPVDNRTAPTSETGIAGELLATIGTIEGGFAPATLLATGICAPADTACYTATNLGDLYYKQICHTGFYTRGLGAGESNVTNLDTDAMLAIANELGGLTALALQNYGSIRSDLFDGQTGNLSFADLYRVVPNGVDPGTATPGFPLVRVAISTVELRLALEGTLLQSMVDGDYFVSGSGIRVEYDKSRPIIDLAAAKVNPFTPGWITRMVLLNPDQTEGTPLYDVRLDGAVVPGVGATHFLVNPATSLQPIVTTYFIALFATSPAFGLTLRDPATGAPTSPDAAILRWPAGRPGTANPTAGVGNAVKDHQSLLKYVNEECGANSGELPTRYNDLTAEGHVPRRMVDCTGGVCL